MNFFKFFLIKILHPHPASKPTESANDILSALAIALFG